MLQNPNRQRPRLPELTDALFLRLQACGLSFRMHAEQSLNAKVLPFMRATREIYEIYVMSQQNDNMSKLWLPLQSSNSSFPKPLESLQGSCSLIILKLLTSEKRFVGKKWKANGWLKGPGVCHHNAAGWSSPETWDQQKWKVEFFSPNIHLLKTKWCIRPLPDALDADMGKLPSRKSKIRSACCRRACDLSSHGKNPGFCAGSVSSWRRKNEPVEKISPQRKCPTLPCSHVPMETSYGFVS